MLLASAPQRTAQEKEMETEKEKEEMEKEEEMEKATGRRAGSPISCLPAAALMTGGREVAAPIGARAL